MLFLAAQVGATMRDIGQQAGRCDHSDCAGG